MVGEVDARALARECKPRGIPLRKKLPTKASADAWAQEVLKRISTEPEIRIEVRELCDRFLKSREAAVAADTLRGYRTATKHLTGFCAGAEVSYTDQITRGVVGDYLDHLLRSVSKRTASQYMAVASVCFEWAVDRGYVTYNPFFGRARRSRETTRRILTDEERDKIVTETEHRDLWVLMLATGIRVIEACRLDTESVRFKSPVPHLYVHGKGDKRRTVPLSREAADAARRLLEKHGGRVWPFGRRELHRVWAEERKALELAPEITPHVFRHDFASWLVNVELLPLPDAQRLLGHAGLATTAIYLHPDGRRVAGAMKGRGKALDGNPEVTDRREA